MPIDKFFVTLSGLGLIGFIWWFFFGRKSEVVTLASQKGAIDITVEGGYKPSTVELLKGIKTTLIFTRTDKNSCLEEVVIPDFKIKKYLPIGQKIEVDIIPTKEGEYEIHCGMNMFHGKIIVK